MPPSDHLSSYPPALTPDQETYILSTIKDWCAQHGLIVRPPPSFISGEVDKAGVLATNAPVTLFPSPFPRKCSEQSLELQEAYNELYAAVSCDEEWIGEVTKGAIEVDDFLQNLWDTHLAVKKEGYVQPLSLGLFRSDYMLHTPPGESPSIKQIEFNTISSSFGVLSALVTDLHTHLLSFPDPAASLAYPDHPLLSQIPSPNPKDTEPTTKTPSIPQIPPNPALEVLLSSLHTAHLAYGPSKSQPPLPLCILIIVQPNEHNIFDQLPLTNSHGYPTFRLPSTSILTHTSIPPYNPLRPLHYLPPSSQSTSTSKSPPYEVTTIYHRAFYSPSEYPTPSAWSARLHLERSLAIKCPSILTQLAGCKLIQQALTVQTPDSDPIARFLPRASPEALSALRGTFAPQYALSSTQGLAIATNQQSAAKHVLKPQREGGGNNIYREAIPQFIKDLSAKEGNEKSYQGYVVMELVEPPAGRRNTVLRSDGSVVEGEVVSEVGIFGGVLWKKEDAKEKGRQGMEVLMNKGGGYLVRTKGRGSDEGGVAAGFSALDSVLLYDDDNDGEQA